MYSSAIHRFISLRELANFDCCCMQDTVFRRPFTDPRELFLATELLDGRMSLVQVVSRCSVAHVPEEAARAGMCYDQDSYFCDFSFDNRRESIAALQK